MLDDINFRVFKILSYLYFCTIIEDCRLKDKEPQELYQLLVNGNLVTLESCNFGLMHVISVLPMQTVSIMVIFFFQ